jgi:protein SCO1/2
MNAIANTNAKRRAVRAPASCLLVVLWLSGFGVGCSTRSELVRWPAAASVFQLQGGWSDDQGRPVRFADWSGKPLVLTMFYRSCQTRCPLTLSKMQSVARNYSARNIDANFVLVTLDPRNDTAARLAAFKSSHTLPDSWHLLSGDDQQTKGLARLLGLRVAYDDGHIDHDVRIWFFDAAGHPLHSYAGWSFEDGEALLPAKR